MKRDLSTKAMTRCRDIFSDICNVNLFADERFLEPEQLELIPSDTVYHDAEGQLREHRMDVRMRHIMSNTEIAIFCLENQSDVCRTMPVRDMGYLYSSYSEQIQKIKEQNLLKGISYYTKEIGDSQKLKPVISLVLYYGTDDWDAPRSLVDLLDIPEEWRKRLEPLIADHPIRIIHLAAQDEETRKKYQSDFRHIVDYLAYVRNKERQKLKEYMGDKRRKVAHPMEYLDLMHAFTNDSRYEKIAENLQENGKESEEINMCIMLDMLEESGIEKGRREEMSHGICVLVGTCHEFGVSIADTISRVAANFELPVNEAELEVKKYWGVSTVLK